MNSKKQNETELKKNVDNSTNFPEEQNGKSIHQSNSSELGGMQSSIGSKNLLNHGNYNNFWTTFSQIQGKTPVIEVYKIVENLEDFPEEYKAKILRNTGNLYEQDSIFRNLMDGIHIEKKRDFLKLIFLRKPIKYLSILFCSVYCLLWLSLCLAIYHSYKISFNPLVDSGFFVSASNKLILFAYRYSLNLFSSVKNKIVDSIVYKTNDSIVYKTNDLYSPKEVLSILIFTSVLINFIPLIIFVSKISHLLGNLKGNSITPKSQYALINYLLEKIFAAEDLTKFKEGEYIQVWVKRYDDIKIVESSISKVDRYYNKSYKFEQDNGKTVEVSVENIIRGKGIRIERNK